MAPHVRKTFGMAALTLALAVVLGTGAGVQAGEGADPDSYRGYDVGDGKVTMDVQDAVFGTVVTDIIQPRTRVNIIVAPEAAEQRVTLRVIDLHWVQALDAMVERIGGVMVRKAVNLLRIERPRPISFAFTDEDIRKVIGAIADYASANVIISPEVQGTITLTLNETPWRESLEQVVTTLGFALVEEDYGILRVIPIDQLILETGYHRFRYIRPPVPYKGVIATQGGGTGSGASGASGGGAGGGGSSGSEIVQSNVYVPSDDPNELEANFPIIEALRSIVAPENGEVRYIPSQNTLIFRGTRPRLEEVRRTLRELDVEPPQIFIDMNFVITANQDALNIGLNAGTNGLEIGYVGADILHMLPFNLGGGGGDVADAISGTSFPSPAGSSFNYGRLTTSQTNMLFSLLQRDTSTRIVQAPKILALDNQEATIFIGESVRYARTTAATNQNGGLTFSVEEDPNSPVNVGFQLLVIPNVIRGEDKIMMTVIPTRRALNGTTSPIIGFDRFELGGETIDLPRVQSTTLKTAMILRDGQTAVIGGLLEDNTRESVDKIPIFGDLPLIGLAFQGKSSTKTTEHLLITITPRILRDTDAANCTISDELFGRSERVEAEFLDIRSGAMSEFPLAPCAPGTGGGTSASPDAPPPVVRPTPPAAPMRVAPSR
ncbi:MAG: type II secretion system protein GspD [Planctomycetota bacterium]